MRAPLMLGSEAAAVLASVRTAIRTLALSVLVHVPLLVGVMVPLPWKVVEPLQGQKARQ